MASTNTRGPGNGRPGDSPETDGPKSQNWPDVPERRGVEDTSDSDDADRLRQMQHGDESDTRPMQERGSAGDSAAGQRGLQENAEGSDYE